MTWGSSTSSGYCSEEDSDSEFEQFFTARTSFFPKTRKANVNANEKKVRVRPECDKVPVMRPVKMPSCRMILPLTRHTLFTETQLRSHLDQPKCHFRPHFFGPIFLGYSKTMSHGFVCILPVLIITHTHSWIRLLRWEIKADYCKTPVSPQSGHRSGSICTSTLPLLV